MVKLFAHRGFALTKNQQNTITSLENAVAANFDAIEFDIWFCQKKLVLKHDKPQDYEIKDLALFHQYLSYGNKFKYWLDFKNLDEKNAVAALKLVKEKIDLAQINLDNIYFAPFITNYDEAEKIFYIIREIFNTNVNLVAVCEELKNQDEVISLRNFLTKNNIKYLSIFHKLLDQEFVKNFLDIEFFAWTVNDLTRIFELEKLGVKNFATDNITPKIYEQNC